MVGFTHLKVPAKEFIAEWEICSVDPTRNTCILLDYLDPEIRAWVDMIKYPHTPKDIGYCTLFNLIEEGDPYTVMKHYARSDYMDIYTDILMVYMELMLMPQFPIYSSPKEYLYILSRLFIFRYSHRIRSWLRAERRINREDASNLEPTYNGKYIDFLLDLELHNPYGHYLAMLYMHHSEKQNFIKITRDPKTWEDIRRLINERTD